MDRLRATCHDGRTLAARAPRRRGPSARLIAVTGLIAAIGVACAGAASTAAAPRPAPAMSGGGYPGGIAAGSDGNIWFTEQLGRIGRITPRGAVTEFPVGPARASSPGGIAAGPDGNLWFTDTPANQIGRITTTGVVTHFSAGISPTSAPTGITAGPDGNLWFTESGANRVGRITTAGVVTEFSAGISGTVSGPITAGPDGNVWFTESAGANDRIGRITPTGTVTEFSAGISHRSGLNAITAGPDGNVWFTEFHSTVFRGKPKLVSRIGRITPAGAVTEFSAGISADSYAGGIANAGITTGPDGNLWFTESNSAGLAGNRIGRITPNGVVTEFSKGISEGSAPAGITAGPDGNLWFTESDASRIGRITPAGVASEFPPTAAILSIRLNGTRAIHVALRCPSGAARQCRGTLSLRLGPPAPPRRPQVRRLRLAPGQRATVAFPLSPVGRRQLAVHRRLAVGVVLVPTAQSTAGSVARPAILRVFDPPAVVG